MGAPEGRTVSTGSMVDFAVEQEAAVNNKTENNRSLVFKVIHLSNFYINYHEYIILGS